MNKIETEYTKYVTCPYCGHIDRDSWEIDFDGMEGDTEIQCGTCDENFLASRIVTVTYCTRKINA